MKLLSLVEKMLVVCREQALNHIRSEERIKKKSLVGIFSLVGDFLEALIDIKGASPKEDKPSGNLSLLMMKL